MAICPTDTTLNCLCIGGQMSPAICQNGVWPTLRVTAQLINPSPDAMQDPTNCSIVADTTIVNELADSAGCWCIGPLMPNFHETDPNQAIQPGGTSWRITVQAELPNGSTQTVFGPTEIRIDAGVVLADLPECCTLTGPCGDCLNIVCLLDAPATTPPTNQFCDAARLCMAGLQGNGLLGGGNVSGDYENGWILDLTATDVCEAVNTTCPATAVQNANGSWTVRGTDGNSVTIENTSGTLVDNNDGSYTWTPLGGGASVTWDTAKVIVSTDAGNLVTAGTDGGALLTCDTIKTCVAYDLVDRGDGSFDLVDVDATVIKNVSLCDLVDDITQAAALATGALILNFDPATGACSLAPIDADLNTTYTLATDTAAAITLVDNNNTVVSTVSLCDLLGEVAAAAAVAGATDEVLVIDPATGDCRRATLPAATVDTNTTYTVVDNGDSSLSLLDDTAAVISTVSLCDLVDDVAQTAFATGSLVMAFDPAAGTCSLSALPADVDIAYTLSTDAAGGVTLVDSNNTVVSTVGLCALIGELAAAATPATATDEILVIDPATGDCRRATIPAGTTDTNTMYTVADNGDGSFSLVDNAAAVVSTVTICDLVDDVTQAAAFTAGSLVMTFDPVAGTCSLAPLPADVDISYTLSTDAAGGVTLVDSDNTVVSTVTLCALLNEIPASTGPVTGTDEILVVDPATDACRRATLPVATNTTVVDYCEFDTTATLSPRVAACDGNVTQAIVTASTAPNGGDEIFDLIVNGAVVGSATLADGTTSVTLAGLFPVATGQVIQVVMQSATAPAASTFGSVTITTECN